MKRRSNNPSYQWISNKRVWCVSPAANFLVRGSLDSSTEKRDITTHWTYCTVSTPTCQHHHVNTPCLRQERGGGGCPSAARATRRKPWWTTNSKHPSVHGKQVEGWLDSKFTVAQLHTVRTRRNWTRQKQPFTRKKKKSLILIRLLLRGTVLSCWTASSHADGFVPVQYTTAWYIQPTALWGWSRTTFLPLAHDALHNYVRRSRREGRGNPAHMFKL